MSKVFQKLSGIHLWNRKVSGPVCCIDFSPKDHWTALGYENGNVQLIDNEGSVCWERNIDAHIMDIKILESKKRVAVLDEGGRLVCFKMSGDIHFNKPCGFKFLSFSVKADGFFLWGWNTGVTHLDSRGKEKSRLRTLRPICSFKVIRRKKQFFVIHDSMNLGLYRQDGGEIWRIKHPVPIDFSEKCADIDISDDGRAVAITSFEKGVYIYNTQNCSLKNFELDKPITRVAVSRDGEKFLLGDPFGFLCLASDDNHIFWETRLANEVQYCRLDQKGSRALVYEKGGLLSSIEFYTGKEERSDFLEVKAINSVLEKKEMWKKTYARQKGFPHGNVNISEDGERVLFNEGNAFYLYDSTGTIIWQRSFMTRFGKTYLSKNGEVVCLIGEDNIFICDVSLGKDKHLTFYNLGIKRFSFDPHDGNFLTVDKKQSLSMYDSTGRRLWKSNLKHSISSAILCGKKNVAVLRISDNLIYFINLKTLKVRKVIVNPDYSKLFFSPTAFYSWSSNGKLISINLNGKIRWEIDFKSKIKSVSALKNKIIVQGQALNTTLLNDKGDIIHAGKMSNSSCLFNFSSNDLLEVIPEKKSVICSIFKNEKVLWNININDGVKGIDVSETGDRMCILGEDFLYYHYLINKPHFDEDPSSFLEF
jgi:outer membrane protein assembly factor BamB